MICKFCIAEIDEELTVCPECGKSLEEEALVDAAAEEEVAQDSEMETEEQDLEELPPKKTKKQKKNAAGRTKVWKIVLAAVCAVVVLAALAGVLLMAFGVNVIELLTPKPNDIYAKESYTFQLEKDANGNEIQVDDSDNDAIKKADVVVATMGDKTLTNSLLQVFYNRQVVQFMNQYGAYLSYIGFDYTKPLSEQSSAIDENLTWEQYFLEEAIGVWKTFQIWALQAEAAGVELDAKTAEEIDKLPETIEEQAIANGYDSADALVQDVMGINCTLADYQEYLRLSALSQQFYASRLVEMNPTDEDCEAYFTENIDTYSEKDITKESGKISDVRHILVMFEGGQPSEDGSSVVYSEEEKTVAYEKAEGILHEWEVDGATEELFAQLANTYTDDTGSATTGGLYTDIAPGSSYYENFLKWSIDMDRQPGDTDIIETHVGYHIMYYVEGEPYWLYVARNDLLDERIKAVEAEAEEKWPAEVTYKKILLAELNFN